MRTLGSRVSPIGNRFKTVAAGSWRAGKASSTQRGYDYKWQKARLAYLAKHPFCVMCMADAGIEVRTIEGVILCCAAMNVPVPYAAVVDHRIPHRGDMALFWDSGNWQSLCTTHHSSDKQRSEADRC
jgi:5-methylcytosine-specific restriction protein A